jgi:acyl carrier protein
MAQSTASKRDTLKSIINNILREKEGASPVETLSDDISLTKDLGLDSLHLAEMTVHLEDEYNVDVFAEDVPNTVGDVLEKL